MKKEDDPSTIMMMICDLNWTVNGAAMAHEWAFVDAEEYFRWHVAAGSNSIFCQAYTFGGYAFYPTKLGPVAPGPGHDLFPRLYELAGKAQMPMWSYFCVGTDLTITGFREGWLIPGSRESCFHGFLAPESEWTDLLCARVEEFLTSFPVDWLLFDWFVYGSLKPDEFKIRPAPFMESLFKKVTGRSLPEHADEISADENLAYKREVLARQFRRIRDTVRKASPGTRIIFNVPYWKPSEALWVDHPMLNESDGLFAECSRPEVVEWLLKIRKPGQRVMTTILGRMEKGECDPNAWQRWWKAGCDFFGYAWGIPPDFRPHPRYSEGIRIIRDAYRTMSHS